MGRILVTCGLALLATVTVIAGSQTGQREEASYVRVEVKGRLGVAPDYRFDPELKRDHPAEPPREFIGGVDPKMRTGAVIAGKPLLFDFELLVRERRQYELVKASDGKTAVVNGELEVVPVPQGFEPRSSPPWPKPPVLRYVIRVKDVRFADPK